MDDPLQVEAENAQLLQDLQASKRSNEELEAFPRHSRERGGEVLRLESSDSSRSSEVGYRRYQVLRFSCRLYYVAKSSSSLNLAMVEHVFTQATIVVEFSLSGDRL